MRVLLDTNGLYTSRAGVARYIQGLLPALRRHSPRIQVDELAWPVANFDFHQPQRALKTAYRELYWYPFLAGRQVRQLKPDLVHYASCSCVASRPGTPEVITLHDLALLRHPERYRRWHLWAGKRRYAHLNRARRVICVSQFTANEAVALLGLNSELIRVVYSGCSYVDSAIAPVADPEFKFPAKYFLFVGSLEPGKNLALLRSAYDMAAESKHRLPPLLIVGARWPGVSSEGAVPYDWHYLGYQPDSLLSELYRRALALVFPSKYEGFGFPIVEAMSRGCPVICSRVASLPEAGGAAACYSDMTPAAYLQAMQRIQQDQNLRQQLSGLGLQHCRKFTWERCAEATAAVYQEVINHQ
jgi:glycosyltransferase involved in cell wall biosynthesis